MGISLGGQRFAFVCQFQNEFFLTTDHSVGFGGKFGVQTDRQDKAAVGYDHVEKLEKHESQKGFFYLVLSILRISQNYLFDLY